MPEQLHALEQGLPASLQRQPSIVAEEPAPAIRHVAQKYDQVRRPWTTPHGCTEALSRYGKPTLAYVLVRHMAHEGCHSMRECLVRVQSDDLRVTEDQDPERRAMLGQVASTRGPVKHTALNPKHQ